MLGTYNANSQIKFKSSMLKSSLCDYATILSMGTITVPNMGITCAGANDKNKKVIFKNCTPFTDWISELNNTKIDEEVDVGTLGHLWQYCIVHELIPFFYLLFSWGKT